MEKKPPAEKDGQYALDEIVRRRDEALRRALSTPPQPKQERVRESTPAKGRAPSAKRGKRGRVA
jgi:hypothetical protein